MPGPVDVMLPASDTCCWSVTSAPCCALDPLKWCTDVCSTTPDPFAESPLRWFELW